VQYREVTAFRAEDARLASVYRECLDASLRRLDLAFAAFFRRLKRGERPGFPRFRSKSRWQTLVFPHGNRALKLDERQAKVTIPGIGSVRLRKGRDVPPFGRAMLTRRAGRWFANFECERTIQPPPPTGLTVGIDRGVVALIATSDGEVVSLPPSLEERRLRVRVAQKRLSRRKRGSGRRRQARRHLAYAHERLASARRDLAHKLSRSIVDRCDMIWTRALERAGDDPFVARNDPRARFQCSGQDRLEPGNLTCRLVDLENHARGEGCKRRSHGRRGRREEYVARVFLVRRD
jgi:putative transposase